MVHTIRRDNLDDQIVKSISDAIISGEWKAGDRLPSETQLAELYNTSRPTVRTAVQKLNALGVLDTKVGLGTFVKDFDFLTNFNYISNLITTPEMQKDVFVFRNAIETACVTLLIERATDEMINELIQKCVDYHAAFLETKSFNAQTLSYLANLDYEFHYRICELSGNSLLAISYAAAQGTLKEYFYLNVTSRYNRHMRNGDLKGFLESPKSHLDLMRAIQEHDIEAAILVLHRIIDYKDDL